MCFFFLVEICVINDGSGSHDAMVSMMSEGIELVGVMGILLQVSL
jgi:hypothetical protein